MANSSCTFFAIVLLLLAGSSDSSDDTSSIYKTFLQCLTQTSMTPPDKISELVYTPQNSSYSSVLQSYKRNARFNSSRKPLIIVTATKIPHVQSTVICTRRMGSNYSLRIRSGGHDFEGLSYVSDSSPFFLLDMSNLRSVDVDIGTNSSWVQSGAILGELYYAIWQKSKVHGFPAGSCPTVGVGGHFSGAGYGNMLRKFGLSVDHIIDAQIVNVDGQLLDRKSMGEGLFWAILGGGGASFGVVVSYKIKLVEVPGTVTVFDKEKNPSENNSDFVYRWQFVAPNTTNDLFLRLHLYQNTASIQSLYLGKADEVVSLLNKDFPELGLTREDCKEMSWIDSVLWYGTADYGKSPDALLNRYTNSPSHPAKSAKRKSDFVVNRVSREGLDRIMNRLVEFSKIRMTFSPYGGEMNEISCAKTPFPHRKGNLYMIEYVGNWVGNDEGMVNELRSMYDYMAEFVSRNPRRAYLNYRDLDIGTMEAGDGYEQGRVYGMKYFSGNFDRLVRVKTEVDPGNFFSSVQSVPTLRRKV
ncbi:Berberine bridge enzyme-like 2 [Linum grandiflorum]